MGYDDESGRSERRRSRARQPVKRPGAREPEYRKNRESRYEGTRHREDSREMYRQREERSRELNLITDTFKDSPRVKHSSRDSENSRGPAERRNSGSRNTAVRETAAAKTGSTGAYRTPEQKRAQKRKRRIMIILLEVLALIGVLVFAAYSYLNKSLNMIQRLPWNPDDIKNVEISQEKQEQMSGYWTIAVFGVDSRNASVGKGNNSDVNIICNINQGTGEIKLVSVYRDTYLNISDKNSYNKLNSAYLQGGPEQAVKALNKNLDLDIDDYATFNWKAVADGINILGGIDLELSKAEFYYINAFVTETVKATGVPSEPVKHAGMVHLDGVQAVAYGRLRLMDTDYARTERQRKVISLAFDKAKKADWATLNNIIQTVFPQVATSIEIADVLSMGRDIGRLHLGESGGFPEARGDADMGSKGACVIPKTLETNVVALHKFLFDDEEYETTETVKAISKKIISDTGMAKAAKPVESVDTKGGVIPKSTEESGSAAATEGHTRETESGGESETYRGTAGWQQWETDEEGNWVEPSTKESQSGPPKPGSTTTQPSGDRPLSTTEAAKPGTTKPGTTVPEETRPGATKPGVSRPTEGETVSPRPGSNTGNTDTGVILGPGNGAPGSGNTGGSQNMPGGGSTGGSQNIPGSGSGSGSQNMPGGGSTGGSQNMPGSGNSGGSQNAPGGNVEFSGPMGP